MVFVLNSWSKLRIYEDFTLENIVINGDKSSEESKNIP